MNSIRDEYVELVSADNGTLFEEVMVSYGDKYSIHQTYLIFLKNGDVVYSSLPGGMPNKIIEMCSEQRYNGERYIFIEDCISDNYNIIYAKYAGDIDKEYRNLLLIYAIATLSMVSILAIVLAIILKKMSVPLDKLRKATEKISLGDLTVTADETGNDEIALLAHSFNNMVKQIKGQMEELTENADQKQLLVDNMAHEIRTPLTSILGYAEYVDKAAISEDERIESIQCVISEAERLQKIAEKMLDMAYIRNSTVNADCIKLGELLLEVADRLRKKADDAHVSIITSTDDSAVFGDRVLLSVLFCNLTENAIKACEKDGKVFLSCQDTSVMVRDNGKGISPEQIPHLTEPFYRTDKSRSRAEGGTGLGLALCKQIAVSHNAEMNIESQVGVGTTVSIIFKMG